MRHALIALLLLLPTLALAGGPKEIQGKWQISLSAEEQAQVADIQKAAEANPEDGLSKAMLKAILAASEAKLTIDDGTMTFDVMGETVPSKYTSKVVDGGWQLTSTSPEGESKTLIASITADGTLQLKDAEGKTSAFKRIK